MKKLIWIYTLASALFAPLTMAEQRNAHAVQFTPQAPLIDGIASEAVWHAAQWHALDQVLIGEKPSKEDFSGRFKLVWDESHIYLLAEIVDDVMADVYADPLQHYWDDEALEIFIDEDASGGDHQYNHSAFAYHIALDGQVVDMGPDKKPQLYNDHISSHWTRSKGKTTWEAAIKVYGDSFIDGDSSITPVKLDKGKKLGFMLAYCDNDGGKRRENFIASEDIKAVNGDRNLGWKDASVFGILELK
ncbi:Carbohydrate family 9 binding domain-like [Alteromonadaceae bacterium Bs31]|nr:Carbohydrate family 9 binding domain-like [Alteromonadaceae bacterium Bs31]